MHVPESPQVNLPAMLFGLDQGMDDLTDDVLVHFVDAGIAVI